MAYMNALIYSRTHFIDFHDAILFNLELSAIDIDRSLTINIIAVILIHYNEFVMKLRIIDHAILYEPHFHDTWWFIVLTSSTIV